MTVQVNIGEAKTRLSELVAAALRGEDVVLQRSGEPKVRLVALPEALEFERAARAAKRKTAVGFARDKYAHVSPEAFDLPPSMTDEDSEARWQRMFGTPAP